MDLLSRSSSLLVPFFAASFLQSVDFRERRPASPRAVGRAPAFSLHPANRPAFPGSSAAAVQFRSHCRRARPQNPRPSSKTPLLNSLTDSSFVDRSSERGQEGSDALEEQGGRHDDPSWRGNASRGCVLVVFVPWPIGLRGCCIIHFPKGRKKARGSSKDRRKKREDGRRGKCIRKRICVRRKDAFQNRISEFVRQRPLSTKDRRWNFQWWSSR